jgi:hypothetical protein
VGAGAGAGAAAGAGVAAGAGAGADAAGAAALTVVTGAGAGDGLATSEAVLARGARCLLAASAPAGVRSLDPACETSWAVPVELLTVTVGAGGGEAASGAGTVGAGRSTGIGGGGGAVLVTTGAAASAWASAFTALDAGPWLECFAGGLGVSAYELVTTGIGWPSLRTTWRYEWRGVRTIRWVRPPWWYRRVDDDVDRTRDAVVAAPTPGPGLVGAPWPSAFGTASAGKRATGTASSGIATRATGGLMIARTDAAISVA